MEKIIEYTNDEVTIVWKPKTCIHSAKCVHGLPEVFKPNEKRWIQMENATSDAIVDAVKRCPSGALTYYMNADGKPNDKEQTQMEVIEVEVIDGGPLMVYGALNLKHANGREELKNRATAFCRCGKTSNIPFCDGTHNN
jgi:uncharacterized Fe-S cluster protein YjdI|tara:strand:- start:52 stop:468 length:417 start_codon:yes stop_codon:yes gene_type:complete